MAYAILRTEKLKTWGEIGASAAHTYRTIPTPNADPARLGQNKTGVGTRGDAVGDIRRRVDQVLAGKPPRANGVLCIEHLLTASPEFFDGLSGKEIGGWAKANIEFLRQHYGKANVVHAVLHMDEKTPHIAAYVVPEHEGRMNARHYLGGREKMRDLQTAYADAMARFGLERGIEGSKRKHVPPRRHYPRSDQELEQMAEQIKKLATPIKPPTALQQVMQGPTKAVQTWQRREKERTKELAEKAVQAALAASERTQEVEQLREEVGQLRAEVRQLREDREQLTRQFGELGLSKEEIAQLRRSDISAVAQRLGHMGEVLKGENAIDLVRRVGGLDYQQSVAWLHAEFGAAATGMMVAKATAASDPQRPFTKAENVIAAALKRQTEALGCDKFRVTLVPADETKKPYLPGKTRGSASEENFYTREDLHRLVPWLRLRNNQGDNVFITPMDDHAQYILLDDARVSAAELKKRGFEPCLVQRTSWDKEQMVFKVPKDLDREAVLAVFNHINQKAGDPEITGLRHPFRAAGFRNMKPKHERGGQRPFVEIVEAVNRFCRRCTQLVQEVIRQRQQPQDLPAEMTRTRPQR